MAETHEIVVVKPKPDAETILRLTSEYFNARGKEYDAFEAATPKRDLFTESVDTIIGTSLASHPHVKRVLSIACGTGRRELDIQRHADRSLDFTGVEISAQMAELSRGRGLSVVEGSWPDVVLSEQDFDAALVLSAFGHVPTSTMRHEFLERIAASLSKDAPLYFDVLNLDDENEWGPKISAIYDSESLESEGFARGDVIYRKIGEPELCFYHYFTDDELRDLLLKSGFRVTNLWCIGYGTHYGEIMESKNGAYLIEAQKLG